MNPPQRRPLPADHPLVAHGRTLARAWAAAVAVQERLTGEPFIPTPAPAPLVANDCAADSSPTPLTDTDSTQKTE
jgi:hypothetical protein